MQSIWSEFRLPITHLSIEEAEGLLSQVDEYEYDDQYDDDHCDDDEYDDRWMIDDGIN